MNCRIGLSLILLLVFMAVAVAGCDTSGDGSSVPDSEDLVASWDFDGDSSDSSGRGNNLITGGSVSYLSNSGRNCVDTETTGYFYIEKELINSSEFTIMLWFYDGVSARGTILGGFGYEFEIRLESLITDELRVECNNTTVVDVDSSAIFAEWKHYTVVYQNKRVKVYINGTEVADTALPPTALNPPHNLSKKFTIGCDYTLGVDHYKDYIDNVKVYSKALTVEQLNYIYDSEK